MTMTRPSYAVTVRLGKNQVTHPLHVKNYGLEL